MTNPHRNCIWHLFSINFILLLCYCNSLIGISVNADEKIMGNDMTPSKNLENYLYSQGYPPRNNTELERILKAGQFFESNATFIVDKDGNVKSPFTTQKPAVDEAEEENPHEKLVVEMEDKEYIYRLTKTIDAFEALGAPIQTQYHLNETIKNEKLEYGVTILWYYNGGYHPTTRQPDDTTPQPDDPLPQPDGNSSILLIIFGSLGIALILAVAVKFSRKFYQSYKIVNVTSETN